MSEQEERPSTIMKEALELIRKAEAKVIKLKEHSDDLEIDPDAKSALDESRDEFMDAVCYSIDYWIELPGKIFREKMEGAVFSILVNIDGEGGIPPFVIPSNGYLSLRRDFYDFMNNVLWLAYVDTLENTR
jgi:hypothetical protein